MKMLKSNKTKTKALVEKAASPNNKQSTTGPTIKKASSAQTLPSDGVGKVSSPDLSGLFFNMPAGRPDGVFEPLICGVAEQLVATGLSQQTMKEAFLIYMAIISARLGHPLSVLLLPDDPMVAVSLLDRVKNLAPADSFIEFQKVKPEQLFIKGGEPYRNKCIVSSDPDGFSKVMPYFEIMLTRGSVVRQELFNRKYDLSLEEFRAEWPVSFVGIAPPKKMGQEWHPSIIRLPIKSSVGIPPIGGDVFTSPAAALPIQKVRKTFERLKSRPVTVPFVDQLHASLIDSGSSYIDLKMDLLIKLISLCAIVNNPEPVTIEELGSYVYGTDVQSVRQFLSQTGRISPSDGVNVGSGAITADRKDLYLARLLLDGLISSDNTYMTERQQRLYNVVKTVNLGKLKLTVDPVDKDNETVSLARIAKSPSCWVDINNIFEFVNNDSDSIIAMGTIYKDLIELLKNGILGRSKPPKRNQYGYFVMRLNLDQSLSLPEPSSIKIPGTEQEAIDIINPLTALPVKI
jgi:hypothetical protein